MDTIDVKQVSRRRRQGQTLAEFAITLPTLLIIMFGIIEFGRIFQAWVTLQNSARTAARFASTGQYYEDQYPMKTILNEATPSDLNSFIPCVDDGPEDFRTYPTTASHTADQRGTKTTVQPNGVGNGTVNVYSGGPESIFATWYDGKNCDPRDADDQDRRKDLARILSIMQEARRGAAGLAIENNQWSVPTSTTVRNNVQTNWNQLPWFANWQTSPRPPRSDQRYWFNVVVCSDRQFVYKDSTAYYQIDTGGASGPSDTTGARFIPYQGDQTLLVNNAVVTPWAPACLLNEKPSPLPAGGFSNAGQNWMDPGAPEDTVFVTVTFNHPLITPLGIAPFITLQARRSAIVETFRTSGNRSGVIFGPPIGANAPTLTPVATDTPQPTATNTVHPSNTPKPPPTPTKVPDGPFDCAKLSISNKRLSGNQVQVDIQNDNSGSTTTYLTRIQITWPNITQFSQFGLANMGINTVGLWYGPVAPTGANTTTDTDATPGNPPFANTPTSDREVPPQDASTFGASFNGPPILANYVSANQYAITLTLFNPVNPTSPCVLTSPATTATNTPVVPGQPTATRTPTPDCASSLIGIKFNSFSEFGIVRYDILSQRTTTSTLVSIKIQWQKYINSQRLAQVTVGAPPGQAGSVVVWKASNVNEDANPPTDSKTEGTWLTNYTLPPGAPGSPSITPIYFDFDGIYRYDDYVNSTSPRYGGSSDFNFSEFELTCGTPGGTAGTTSGGQPTGKITPENYPTPTTAPTQGPTNTPKPTNTPAPTLTASKTPTKGPATNTFTPKPPTATPPPTATTGPQAPPTAGTGN